MEQGFLDLARTAYWLVVALFLALALWLPATRRGKIGAAALVAIIALIPTLINLQHREERKEIAAREQVLVSQATRRFEELCKGAGAKIYRTVDDVDGLMLLKVRPKLDWKDYNDPMLPGAAMAGEKQGEWYLRSFLGIEGTDMYFGKGGRGSISGFGDEPLPRYRYVEVVDAGDGKRYRYVLSRIPIRHENSASATTFNYKSEIQRETVTGSNPRYAVDFLDTVDPADRKLWIAGTTIRVLDQKTGEVLAEYTEYSHDAGLGVTDGTRAPWEYAASHANMRCPDIKGATDTHTRYFVDQVLRPKSGVNNDK